MKKFRVYASYVSYCYLDVEAETADEALTIAESTDGGEFIPYDTYNDGRWTFEGAEEIEE